jgi:hypothetical protein
LIEEDCNGIVPLEVHIPYPLITGPIITPFAKEPTSIEEAVVGMGWHAHSLWM